MKFLLPFVAIFLSLFSYGQNNYPYGQFNIRNFDRTEFNGGVQSWDIIQNSDHFIYVANNAGVLEFNGEQWTKFELENTEHPRSFAKDEHGTIYIGGQNEFGKIQYDKTGKPFSKKLSESVDTIDFKDIWKVHCIEEKTYFVARKYVFILDSNKIEVINSPNNTNIKKSLKVDNQVICTQEFDQKIISYVLRGNKFIEVSNSSGVLPSGFTVFEGKTYLIDEQGLFYEFMVNGNNYKFNLTEKKLNYNAEGGKFKGISSNDKLIISAVQGQGIQIFSTGGELIRTVGEEDGLNNSIVRKALFDQYNNLWLCTDNGISFVEMSSAITSFGKKEGVTAGITEDLLFKDDKILLATHSDLFTSVVENNKMRFENTKIFGIDTWQIKQFTFSDSTTHTIVIANDGIYELGSNLEKSIIARFVYAWDLSQSTSDRNRIFIGLDGGGVGSMYYKGGKFEFEGNYGNTGGDVRSVIEHEGEVYYSVKYDGIHMLDTTREQKENVLQGLIDYADDDQGYEQFTLSLFNGTIYVGTVHGLYEIQDGKLIPSPVESNRFNEQGLLIHRIINDGHGKLWIEMFHNSGKDNESAELGYLTEVDGELKWFSAQFNQIKDDVIFSVKKAEDGIYWLGGVKGVYAYNSNAPTNYDDPFNVFISGVYLNDENEYLYHTNYSTKEEHILGYQDNSIRFEFASNSYLGGLNNEYSYYLEGEEEIWSKWKTTPFADYQRLREGKYTLHLKARNFYGFESEVTTFTFTITPPWYRTWWAFLIYIALFALLIYVVIRLSIRRVKAQNERLEQIVEERTAEIAEQNTKLEHQKAEIEEKTNDILDSIKYAERIQTAILPTEDTLNEIFDGEHFVLYKPKDIVSGDFYWADRFGDEAIFSAVDCTGHGVPGAFVSIVGFNGLNRTVHEFDLRKPAQILDKLTELVVETFAKSESQIKDGMDIALCNINYKTKKLQFAGANNPLCIVRNGEIIEVKANKQPIGEFHDRVPFTNHEIDLMDGDCVYVFSDGFADQFGGDKGKKFKGKALKQLLLELSDLDMKTQHKKLNEAFETWKGDFEQLDDVCLFGVKI
ncbi:SpoIIE family protein phosphatase [Paracrocinitomix mangrovi]|uniref:SpoIIE family protein phosphatase n=1 Tax=Paracrocinitomix mangrovi TaxID=2862509 RepID=UPI001C8D5DC8|nr:SpoIIE family protein phosphatase [Paracrocinitomix mangrovi]UKN03012.1 SpoIIE family protein phosphatase [Paracrocinitomix mangrovi]